MQTDTQKIMPCLWFDDRIEEAVKFYTSVFPNAKVTRHVSTTAMPGRSRRAR